MSSERHSAADEVSGTPPAIDGDSDPAEVTDTSEPAGGSIERTPLLIWAFLSLISVVLRSVLQEGAWALDRWGVLSQWDSHTILAWVEGGDTGGSFVMPGYALLIRGSQWITGDVSTTAVLITYASSAVASYLLWEWLAGRGHDRSVRAWAVGAMLCFPYSFVLFGVVGPEALALALLLATFVLLEKDRPIPAGFAAAAAVTVTITALAVLPALAVLAWRERRPSGLSDDRGSAAVDDDDDDEAVVSPGIRDLGALWTLVLSLLGPLLLTVFSAWDRGDAWLVWSGDGGFRGLQAGVTRIPTWVRVGWLLEDAPASWTVNRAAQALLMIAFVVLAYWVWRRFGSAMAVLTIGVAILTLVGYPGVASSGRHLTAAFPLAGLAGLALARMPRAVAGTLVVASTAAMFLFYGYYINSIGFPFW